MSDMGSEVANFYRGRSVFITGASGFIGKVLLEKLLRSCPEISNVYILMRSKRGSDVKTRMEDLLSSRLFDTVRKDCPASLQKVVPVVGDIALPGLGLSHDEAALLHDNVSVVFHSAATVKFDEPLKHATLMNIVGTKSLVEVCQKMTKIAAIIHVSTAYSNCHLSDVDEILYPSPAQPEKFIEWLQWMDEDVVNDITPKLLGPRPNTYTYTKAIAEHLFADLTQNVPSAIVRPSIVAASWREPAPGWIDNLNGPTGLMVGVGKGLIRSLYCRNRYVTDIIPVDILTNLLIVVAWRTATVRSKVMPIYHCTSSTTNPVSWKMYEETLKSYMVTKPFESVIWMPGGTMKSWKIHHQLCVLLYHLAPSYFFDAAIRLCGKKPFMVNLQKKVWRAVGALEYFMSNEWRFSCKNTTRLFSELGPEDKRLFNFDISNLSWSDYMRNYFEGVRMFILKETPTKTPHSLRKMYLLRLSSQLLFVFLLLRICRPWIAYKKILMTTLDFSLSAANMLGFP